MYHEAWELLPYIVTVFALPLALFEQRKARGPSGSRFTMPISAPSMGCWYVCVATPTRGMILRAHVQDMSDKLRLPHMLCGDAPGFAVGAKEAKNSQD